MDLDYPTTAEEFRATVRGIIADNVPADFAGVGALARDEHEEFTRRWHTVLAEHNLLAVSWPKEYGGAGFSLVEQVVVAEEFARAGVPMGTESDMFGIQLLGNTMLVWGTEEQKRHFLPRIMSGQDAWCQGFSEPDAGSDLGSLRTRAVRDGDEWVINGSKIWTSTAEMADWIFVLCRTDSDAPKHRGISMLLAPMDQPGIEVRPITNVIGESFFNEVFFTDARTKAVDVLGPLNGGWKVAMTMLGFERGTSATTDAIRFEADLDRLVRLARERGLADDPHIREQLAWCHGRVEIMRSRGHQALTRFLRGEFPGPEAAINKIVWSEFFQRETELALEMLGADALTPTGPGLNGVIAMSDPGTSNSTRSWVESAMNARAATIYAGSSQVQRNIIGEQLLGLPKEPRP